MYYSNGFDSAYEELITFYPVFYRDVFEMRAILEAEGKIVDEATATINGVIENSFVESADEATITRLEAWLHLQTDTSADSNIYFKPTDEAGNNTLIIEMGRGENADISYSDIKTVLDKKIPAHIAYKAFVTYSAAIAISKRRAHYKHEYRLCGLEPEIALLGKKQTKTSVTESDAAAESYGTDYRYCGTALAGNV